MELEIKQALDELNDIAIQKLEALEKELKPELSEMRVELSKATKSLGILQVKPKSNGGSFSDTANDMSFPGATTKRVS
jgi:hypothetical protein